MLRSVMMTIGLAGALSIQALADPGPGKASKPNGGSPSIMRVFGSALPPFGFVDFCERVPSECVAVGSSDVRIDASPQRMAELDEVNRAVNRRIQPVTDYDLYGVQEYWTLPVDRGDCEDYVLLKRQILIKRGWPSGALLITVVRDEHGDGHAVLTARTAQGDYVLDNKVSNIRLWHQTGYRFIMRQSYVDPKMWMSLAPDDAGNGHMLTSMPSRH